MAIRDTARKKRERYLFPIAMIVFAVMATMLILEIAIRFNFSKKSFYTSADLLTNQLTEVLHTNEEEERELAESLKNEYTIRAHAASYIIEHSAKENIENDVEELGRIAKLLDVDEIHLFNTDGVIYSGSIPKYFGYSFDSGEQMNFFRQILSDKTMSLCQDVTPNTAESKQMMYAMVWKEDGTGMVQIGLEPTRLLERMQRNSIENAIFGMPVMGYSVIIADKHTGAILGTTDNGLRGLSLPEIGISLDAFQGEGAEHVKTRISGVPYYASFTEFDEFDIAICTPISKIKKEVYFSTLFVFVYLLIASIAIIVTVDRMRLGEMKKDEGYRKALEDSLRRAESANESKSSFLFNMSQDLRTPITSIIGYADHAKNANSEKENVQMFLDGIHSTGEQLLALINNILEMARLESGEVTLTEKECDIRTIKDSLISEFKPEAQAKGVKLAIDDNITEHTAYCDLEHVTEVISRITSNAIKYTPKGGKAIVRLETGEKDDKGNFNLVVTVSDTGIGIAKAFLPYIYDSFSKEHSSTLSANQGSGLGLSISKRIVDALRGSIEADSEIGRGTTFVVTLPMRSPAIGEEIEEEIPDFSLHGYRVLIADDSETSRKMTEGLLSDFGVECDGARDGREAINMLLSHESGYYLAILMDLEMPVLNGLDATREIRALDDKAYSETPIIALSAYAFDDDITMSKEAGMDMHIAKPPKLRDLMNALKRAEEIPEK